jgi:hypothetical protein
MGATIHTSYSPTPPVSPGARRATVGFVDETYVKVGGVCRYVYRAVDQTVSRPTTAASNTGSDPCAACTRTAPLK